jgi:quinol monooxygenase YgiN
MEKVAVFARLVARDGQEEALIEALRTLFPSAERNPGVEIFAMHQTNNDPHTIWFYELHADLATFTAQDGAAARLLGDRLTPLLAEPPEVLISRPILANGLPG